MKNKWIKVPPLYIECPQCGTRYSTEICTVWRFCKDIKRYIGNYEEPRYCPRCGVNFEEEDDEQT